MNDRNLILNQTITDLKTTQQQLLQQEKLAALGQLVAVIAHEINTPLGAIKTSSENNQKALIYTLIEFPKVPQYLNLQERDIFLDLLDANLTDKFFLSSRDKRKVKKKIINDLDRYEIKNSRQIANLLIDMGIYGDISFFIPLLIHPKVDWILNLAYNLTRLLENNRTIVSAIDKASKIVFALKNYTQIEYSQEKQVVDITEGLYTALDLYQTQLNRNIELLLEDRDIPKIWCYPEEINQVWTNLIIYLHPSWLEWHYELNLVLSRGNKSSLDKSNS